MAQSIFNTGHSEKERMSFIGRVQEQRQFLVALQGMLAHHRRWFELAQAQGTVFDPGQAPRDASYASIFLPHGIGGIGKSWLTRRCLELAGEMPNDPPPLTLYDDISLGAPVLEATHLLDRLHDHLAQAGYQAHLAAYRQAKAETPDIVERVTRYQFENREQWQKLLEMAATLRPQREPESGYRSFADSSIAYIHASGVEAAGRDAATLIRAYDMLLEQMADEGKIEPPEIALFRNPPAAQAAYLAAALTRIAAERPLVIGLDNLEIIVPLEPLLRDCLVIPTNYAPIIWILTGRYNLADERQVEIGGETRVHKGYRDLLGENPPVVWDMSIFGDADLRDYLVAESERRRLPLLVDDELIEAVKSTSSGVPLVVEMLADALFSMDRAEFLSSFDLGERGLLPDDRLDAITERFLRYCLTNEADLERVQAMALLRKGIDEKALAAVWKLPPDQSAQEVVRGLRSRYAFVVAEGLHDAVYEFVRRQLRGAWQDSEVRERLSRRAVRYFQAEWETLEASFEDTALRVRDPRWQRATRNLLNALLWNAPDGAVLFLLPRFVEGLGFDRAFADGLLSQAEEFLSEHVTTFSGAYANLLHRMRVGMQDIEWFFEEPGEAIGAMLETLLEAPGLEPLHLSILQLWRGNWLVENSQYEAGLAAYQEADRHRPETAAGLARQLGRAYYELSSRFLWPKSAFETVPSEPGLQAAQRAVELDPAHGAAWFNLGAALDYLGREAESISAYQRAIEIEARALYYNNLGNVHGALGHDDEAMTAYEQAIELEPDFAWPYHNLGQIYADQGDYELALSLYQQAIERHRSDRDRATSWDEFGDVCALLENYDEAISAYRWAGVLNPKFALPWYGLGNVYSRLEQYRQAIDAYQKAINLDLDHAWSYQKLGLIYAQQGDYIQAMQLYQQALERHQDDEGRAVSHHSLGAAYLALKRYPEALEAYRQALKLDETQAISWYSIGQVYSALDNPEAAIRAYRRAIQIDPDYGEAWHALGDRYRELELYDEAAIAYERVIALQPAEAWPYHYLGLIYQGRGESKRAISFYEQAIERHTDDVARALSWNELGDLHVSLGNREQAIRAYRSSVSLHPDEAWPHHKLARLYEERGDDALAIDLYRQAIERHDVGEDRAASWHNLADLYRRLERRDEAIHAYQQVIDLDGATAETWRFLGDVYLASARDQEAATAYRQAIALNPDDARPYFSLGLISTKLEWHEAARDLYRQAIARQKDALALAVTWKNLGDAYTALDDLEEAAQAYRQAITFGPAQATPYHRLAEIQEAWGEAEAALNSYQQAIARYPAGQRAALALAWNGVGDANRTLKRYEAAIEAYHRSGDFNPARAAPWNSLGDIHQMLGQSDQAIRSYQQALELEPAEAYPYHHMGLVYERLAEYELAMVRFQQALERYRQPGQEEAEAETWNHLGNCRRALTYQEQAIEAYRRAIELDQAYATPWNSLGEIYADQERSQEAITAFQRAIELDAKLSPPWRGLGDTYRALGRHQEATNAYKRAIELDLNDAWSYYGLGLIEEQVGQPGSALNYYEQAIKRYPADQTVKMALAWIGLGNVYRAESQDQQAIVAYHRAIQLDPAQVWPYHSLGDIYSKLGQYETAVSFYRQAIERYAETETQQRAEAWNGLGDAYRSLGRWPEAIEAYQRACVLDSDYALPWYHLGDIYHGLGRFDEAEQAYRQSIELDPGQAWPYNNLGLIYERTGRYPLALEYYQKAVERHSNPQDKAISFNNIGNVYYIQRQYEEAVKAYRQAIFFNPAYARPWNSLGDVYQAQGSEKGVVEAYLRAIELEPAFAWPYHNLGDFYKKKGAYAQAITYYRQAIERHPTGLDRALSPAGVPPRGDAPSISDALSRNGAPSRNGAASWNGLGDVYRALQQYDQAIEAYQKAIQLKNDEAWPYHNLAFVYKSLGHHQQAATLYQQAIERFKPDKHKAVAWNNLGNVYTALGRYEAAVEAYQEATRLNAAYALPWNSMGEVYNRMGQEEAALKAFQAAIQRDPDYLRAWSNLGDTFWKLDRVEETIKAYERAIALDPTYVWPYHNLGVVHEERADYESAIHYYQEAIERHQNPEHKAILWDRIGNIYRLTGQLESAIETFRRSTGADPRYAAPWYSLGNIYAALEQDEEAIHAYRRAIELSPNDPWPYHNLALVYEKREVYGEAIALYQQAIERHTTERDRAISWDSLGNVYSDVGRYEEAIQAFRRSIEFNPNYALPWNSLGDVSQALGDYQQAVNAYQRAIALDPDYAWPYNNLGLVYENMQEYELAIATYKKVINRHTSKRDQAISWNSLGDVYEALTREEEAIKAYEQAILLDPDYIWPYNSLGAIYEKRGDQDQAYALYQQATRRHRQRSLV
jgi:superkiller protein 3